MKSLTSLGEPLYICHKLYILAMSQQIPQNRRIHHYIESLYARNPPTPDLADLPQIAITPMIGKMLYLLAKTAGARRILEIGTLGGYSTLWLASALPPDGHLTTLEIDPAHAAIAAKNFVDHPNIRLITGPALQTLPTLTPPFDLIFLDADKTAYPAYIEPLLALSRPGTLLLTDNTIRKGKVIDPKPTDPQATAVHHFNNLIADHPRLESTILPTFVGYAGGSLDGLTLTRVLS